MTTVYMKDGSKHRSGSHLEPQVTTKQRGWRVESRNGTDFVPNDVVRVPYILATGRPIRKDDALFEFFRGVLKDYIEGDEIVEIEVIGPCYFVRLSAPGFLDCTEWQFAHTMRDVRRIVRELTE